LQLAIKSKCPNVVLNIHENHTYCKSVGVSPKLNIVNILKIISHRICGFLNLLHLCGENKKFLPLSDHKNIFLRCLHVASNNWIEWVVVVPSAYHFNGQALQSRKWYLTSTQQQCKTVMRYEEEVKTWNPIHTVHEVSSSNNRSYARR